MHDQKTKIADSVEAASFPVLVKPGRKDTLGHANRRTVMRYRRLGQWGIKVSEVTLGTWLTHGGRAGEDTAVKTTRRAYELGVNLFDTANVYPEGNEGDAERVLGTALSTFPRETYLVATKVFSPMGPGPLQRGLSRKHIIAQVDGSLSRLGLDHIDLYQCHRYDPEVPLEETAGTMNDLVERGKILYWGVSEWSSDQLEHAVTLCRANGWALPVSNQPRYSALWRKNATHVLPTCERLGMGVLAFAPLDHGVLSGKYRSGDHVRQGTRAHSHSDGWMFERYFNTALLEAVQSFRLLVENVGYSPTQVALAWCLRHTAVTSVVVGASSLAQLEENLAVSDLDIDDDVIGKADDILSPVRVA